MLGERAGVVAHAHELGACKSDESIQLFTFNNLQRSLKHVIYMHRSTSTLIRLSSTGVARTSKLILHHRFDPAHAVRSDGQDLFNKGVASVRRGHDDGLFAYIRGKFVLCHVEHVAIHKTNNIVAVIFGAVLEYKLHDIILMMGHGHQYVDEAENWNQGSPRTGPSPKSYNIPEARQEVGGTARR